MFCYQLFYRGRTAGLFSSYRKASDFARFCLKNECLGMVSHGFKVVLSPVYASKAEELLYSGFHRGAFFYKTNGMPFADGYLMTRKESVKTFHECDEERRCNPKTYTRKDVPCPLNSGTILHFDKDIYQGDHEQFPFLNYKLDDLCQPEVLSLMYEHRYTFNTHRRRLEFDCTGTSLNIVVPKGVNVVLCYCDTSYLRLLAPTREFADAWIARYWTPEMMSTLFHSVRNCVYPYAKGGEPCLFTP